MPINSANPAVMPRMSRTRSPSSVLSLIRGLIKHPSSTFDRCLSGRPIHTERPGHHWGGGRRRWLTPWGNAEALTREQMVVRPVPARQPLIRQFPDGDARTSSSSCRLQPATTLGGCCGCGARRCSERRDGELVKIVVEPAAKASPQPPRLRRAGRGGAEEGLRTCSRCLCGKRLVAVLRTQLSLLEKFGELALAPRTRAWKLT